MTTLYQRLFLRCPYRRAQHYLEEALATASTTRESDTIRLTVPLTLDLAALQKDVTVTYGFGHDAMHFDQPWKIHWTPAGGGPFPNFDGELTVRADEDYDRCILELRGDYQPPFGAVGEAFDALVGSRIASMTARELLRGIGLRMEEQYLLEETEKKADKGA